MAVPREVVKTALRVPVALHQRIHEEAKKGERTFNAEIIFRLAGAYGGVSDKKESQQ
jgi:hypothetical protein